MRVVFISNYLNHHQLPLAQAFCDLPGVDYTFVATTPFNSSRAAMGYEDVNSKYGFVHRAYESPMHEYLAHSLVNEADIVIVGSAPDNYMIDRLNMGKVTFHASERYFKRGLNIRNFPRNFASSMKHIRPFQNKPLYYLCSSAYTAYDVNLFANYSNRCFKWAYFLDQCQCSLNDLNQKRNNDTPILLWAGRFVDIKHPDVAIRLSEKLKRHGCKFRMNIIGGGGIESQLKSMVNDLQIDDVVNFLGFFPPEKVRSTMETSDVFLFTSDFNEGWGAVLSEAMSSACAVVSSHAPGSAPFLIRNGENGFIYRNGEEDQLFEIVEMLLNNKQKRVNIGNEAYNDMQNLWNADIAAKRLINLYDAIINNESTSLFKSGPCSPAEIINNQWY